MPQAISAGAFTSASSQSTRTISVNPSAIGNLVVLFAQVESATGTTQVSAVSGGNCTWTNIISFVSTADSSVTGQESIWMGVATGTGSSTATVTTSGSGSWVDLDTQQFTCAGVSSATKWLLDGSAATKNNTTSSTTMTYPTLTPSDSGRMYVGFGCAGVNAATTASPTTGYTVVLDPNVQNAIIYNTSVSGAQSPTSQEGTGKSMCAGFLIYAQNPSAASPALYLLNVPMMRAGLF